MVEQKNTKGAKENRPDPRRTPRGIHIMAKPIGSVCNLRCAYCYYLEKEALYPDRESYRMPDEVLEAFIRKYIEEQPVPEVEFVWQGGEPTLLGFDFFRKAIDLERRYARGKRIKNSLQTNGTLLTDEWCRFLARHNFLVGFSLDGPEDVHNRYRVDGGGKPTFQKVMRGLELLKKYKVEFNVLSCVSRENAEWPEHIYRFYRDQGAKFIQFIPIVERALDAEAERLGLKLGLPPSLDQKEAEEAVTPWTVKPEAYGNFLSRVFDEWVRNDVGKIFVMNFEWALNAWMGMVPPACFFTPRCGRCLIIEHNGDVYSCDHFVYPDYFLGNILQKSIAEMVDSDRQVAFGAAKETALPRTCRECNVLVACRGECPKHRFLKTPDGEPGLNYLCAGYKRYFRHIAPALKEIAHLIRRGRPAAEIMRSAVFYRPR